MRECMMAGGHGHTDEAWREHRGGRGLAIERRAPIGMPGGFEERPRRTCSVEFRLVFTRAGDFAGRRWRPRWQAPGTGKLQMLAARHGIAFQPGVVDSEEIRRG